ncbi:MAG TPA: hypothetical protein PK002_16460 [Cellvibrio sp.]|nr:hypothetical protein [Cellvibrio sp.]
MNITLKERVNSKRIKFTFIFAVFLSLFISRTFAQENQQPFDYTKTVWIIHVIEGGGIVYGRPEPEEYDPRQGLIYIYEILIKYVYSMQDLNASRLPNSLNVTHELILMNGLTEQRLLIGEHWISDERSIAVMSEVDYNNLKEWLKKREKNEDYKNPPIDKLVKAFRNGTSPDIESFDKYFNSNQTSSVSTEIQNSTANTQLSVGVKADEQPIQIASQYSSSRKVEASIGRIDSSAQFNRDSFSTNSITPTKNLSKSKKESSNFSLWLNLAIGFLLAIGVFVLWKRKKG